MNHSELVESRSNPAPKPPGLTKAKIKEGDDLRAKVEAFIAKGKNYTVLESTKAKTMTAKEQMAANYDKDVENGKKMSKPLKPRKRKPKV